MLARSASNALPKPQNQIFRFRGCLFARRDRIRNGLRPSSSSAVHTIPASTEDKALVSLFDHPKSALKSTIFASTGLFRHHTVHHPRALLSLADATLIRARVLTDRILRARDSRDELFKVVKNLDRLSDLLCGVIDLAELIRNAHPDRAWVNAANEAFETMCEYMNVLNTHVGLYEVRRMLYSHLLSLDSHV